MMAEAYYNPNVALEAGLEALLRGMIAQPKAKVEPRWSLAMAGNFAGHSTINGGCVGRMFAAEVSSCRQGNSQ